MMNETQAIIQIAAASGIVGAMGGYIAGKVQKFDGLKAEIHRLKAENRQLKIERQRRKPVRKPRRAPYDYKDELDSTQRFPVVDADG